MSETPLTTFRLIAVGLLLLTVTSGCDFVRTVQDQFVTEAPEGEFVPPPSKHGDVPVEFKTENEEIISAKQFMELTWEQELYATIVSLKMAADRKVTQSLVDFEKAKTASEERGLRLIKSLEEDVIEKQAWYCLFGDCKNKPSTDEELHELIRDRFVEQVWGGSEPIALAETLKEQVHEALVEYTKNVETSVVNALKMQLENVADADELIFEQQLSLEDSDLKAAIRAMILKPGKSLHQTNGREIKELNQSQMRQLYREVLAPALKGKKREEFADTVATAGTIGVVGTLALSGPLGWTLGTGALSATELAVISPAAICTFWKSKCGGKLNKNAEEIVETLIKQINQDVETYYVRALCGDARRSGEICNSTNATTLTTDYKQYTFAISDIEARALLHAVGRELEKRNVPARDFKDNQ